MRYWWWALVVIGVVAAGVVAARLDWFRACAGRGSAPGGARRRRGDRLAAQPDLLRGVGELRRGRQARRDGRPDRAASRSMSRPRIPDRTTAVPEIVIRRKGYAGGVRIRWYKVTDEASQEAWVKALARRDRPPIAVLGGWSSDRAKELADAMRDAPWAGEKPLLFISQATADEVYRAADSYPVGYVPPQLIKLYDRSFRFCFTNKQMAEAVTDYVFSDKDLRPGPIPAPSRRRCRMRLPCPVSRSPGRTTITRSICRGSSAARSTSAASEPGGAADRHDPRHRALQRRAPEPSECPRGGGRRTDPAAVAAARQPDRARPAHGQRAGAADAAGARAGKPGHRRATGGGHRRRHRRQHVLSRPRLRLAGAVAAGAGRALHARRPVRVGRARRARAAAATTRSRRPRPGRRAPPPRTSSTSRGWRGSSRRACSRRAAARSPTVRMP